MAEEKAPEAAAEQPQPVNMKILTQYIRDMSFENILAQKGAAPDTKPNIQVQVALDANKRQVENQYEVVVKTSVINSAQDSDAKLFLLELEYAGLFHVENIAEEQLHPFLMIECPRMLFPYIRRVVSDITRDGGFPPVNLENIDFMGLYRTEIARRLEAQKAEATSN